MAANWETNEALKNANAQVQAGIDGKDDAQVAAGMAAQQQALGDMGIVMPTSGGGRKSKGASYDLSDHIKQQAAASLEAELAGLKGAYEKSMLGYDAAAKNLPAQYQQAKNQAAAQNAQEKRAFDERAAAAGMSSGTNAQAQLAMSSVYQNQLAGLDREQAEGLSDIELQKAQLKAEYQNAMLQAHAKGNAQLASDLYKEMIRLQGFEREDEQTAALWARQDQQLKDEWDREDAQTAQEEKNAERDYARQLALTYELVKPEDIGRINSLADLAALTATGAAVAPAAPGGTPRGAGFDNGDLTPEQVSLMQNHYGLTADGMWGPNSQQITGKSADEAWTEYRTSGPYGFAPLHSGRSDSDVIAQAKWFVEEHPTVAWNSRTVDYYLAASELTSAEKTLFKEYLKAYAPSWGTGVR